MDNNVFNLPIVAKQAALASHLDDLVAVKKSLTQAISQLERTVRFWRNSDPQECNDVQDLAEAAYSLIVCLQGQKYGMEDCSVCSILQMARDVASELGTTQVTTRIKSKVHDLRAYSDTLKAVAEEAEPILKKITSRLSELVLERPNQWV